MPPPGRQPPCRLSRLLPVALLLALAGTGCGRGAAPSSPAATPAPPCPEVVAPAGVQAPLLPRTTCELPEFDPARFRQLLGQLRGVPVVVNVWASWCGPCLEEAPQLARVSRSLLGRVQFLGVDVLDRLPPARAFVLRFGWPYPSVFDPRGAIRDSLGLLGQPHTLIYDREGRLAFTWSGPVTEGLLRGELARVLEA
jgi:cytochrome c biogenesis protein CcmG/thiol:disulfide interchange protein DsbE